MTHKDRRLIFSTFACGGALLAIYAAAIQLTLPDITASPSTSLANRLFVERYVYGQPAPNVLVGSSLTRRVPLEALGPAFTNLALDGESALTGLAITAASPPRPQRVYIEINQIGMGSNTSLLQATFSEPLFTARRVIAALRKTYQPGNVLYALVRGHKDSPDASGSRTMTAGQRQGVITANGRSLRTPWPDEKLNAALKELSDKVDALRKRGIEPVFYEMPIEQGLQNLPQPLQVRKALLAAYPPAENCWITIAPQHRETLDGLHLTDAGASEAGKIFRKIPPCERTLTPAR